MCGPRAIWASGRATGWPGASQCRRQSNCWFSASPFARIGRSRPGTAGEQWRFTPGRPKAAGPASPTLLGEGLPWEAACRPTGSDDVLEHRGAALGLLSDGKVESALGTRFAEDLLLGRQVVGLVLQRAARWADA